MQSGARKAPAIMGCPYAQSHSCVDPSGPARKNNSCGIDRSVITAVFRGLRFFLFLFLFSIAECHHGDTGLEMFRYQRSKEEENPNSINPVAAGDRAWKLRNFCPWFRCHIGIKVILHDIETCLHTCFLRKKASLLNA